MGLIAIGNGKRTVRLARLPIPVSREGKKQSVLIFREKTRFSERWRIVLGGEFKLIREIALMVSHENGKGSLPPV